MNFVKFSDKILSVRNGPLTALGIKILQVNIGYRCNMSCSHCHVTAGPARSESMDGSTVDAVLRVLQEGRIDTLDITGGSPEINPHFRTLVTEARKGGKRVIARTNLTIFSEQGMEDLPEFYRDQRVELIASLPCYLEDNVDAVRGEGTFVKSVEALRRLNSLGFGSVSMGQPLSLVYNPRGPFLPPSQSALETDYKRELKARYDISFSHLYAFSNMPIGRFYASLVRNGELIPYLDMLAASFNPATLDNLMCRSLVNVGWDGRLYDCDFNQAMGISMAPGTPKHIRDFDFSLLSSRKISVDDHCYACAAGQGST